jgi:hypothetical protein
MAGNRQSTTGSYSPNFNTGGGDLIYAIAGTRPTGTETRSILGIITDLTAMVLGDDTEIVDIYQKRLKEKLEKYPDYATRLRYDYGSLIGIYAHPYDEAWQNSDVDELTKIKIARYLSGRSIVLLDECSDNALKAIERLRIELEECFEKNVEFDSSAVRFFIYRQFIECISYNRGGMMSKKLLIDESQNLEETGVYIGAIILKALQKKSKVSIFDVYDLLRREIDNVNYSNVMDGIVFLHMLGAIKFTAPYIVKVQ